MLGAIVLVAVMVVVFPPILFASGMLVAGLLGWTLKDDADDRYEGTEYLKLQ